MGWPPRASVHHHEAEQRQRGAPIQAFIWQTSLIDDRHKGRALSRIYADRQTAKYSMPPPTTFATKYTGILAHTPRHYPLRSRYCYEARTTFFWILGEYFSSLLSAFYFLLTSFVSGCVWRRLFLFGLLLQSLSQCSLFVEHSFLLRRLFPDGSVFLVSLLNSLPVFGLGETSI